METYLRLVVTHGLHTDNKPNVITDEKVTHDKLDETLQFYVDGSPVGSEFTLTEIREEVVRKFKTQMQTVNLLETGASQTIETPQKPETQEAPVLVQEKKRGIDKSVLTDKLNARQAVLKMFTSPGQELTLADIQEKWSKTKFKTSTLDPTLYGLVKGKELVKEGDARQGGSLAVKFKIPRK